VKTLASSVSNLFAAIGNVCCPIYLQPPSMSASHSLPSQVPAETMGSRGYCNGANMRSACHCLNLFRLPKLAVLTLPKLAITLSIMRRNACRVKQGLQCQRLANYSSSFGYKPHSEYQPHSVSSLIPQSFCRSWPCVALSLHLCCPPSLFPSLPGSASSCSS